MTRSSGIRRALVVALTIAVAATVAMSTPAQARPPGGDAEGTVGHLDVTVPNADRCEFFDAGDCMLPFPSDRFTTPDASTPSGRRVAIDPQSTPANTSGVHIDPDEWNKSDGFSPGSMIVLQVPGLDLGVTGAPPINDMAASLAPDSPIVLLDANTHQRWPFWAELDSRAPSGGSRQALLIHPAVNFVDGHRLIVALRHLKRADGTEIEPSPVFRAYRDRLETDVPEVEARRPAINKALRLLQNRGVPRADLYLAWDFTVASTQSLTGRIISMRDDAFASLAGHAPHFAVTSVTENPDTTGSWDRDIKGTLDVPNYLTGTGEPGSGLNNAGDPNGVPTRNGTITVPFTCVLPRLPGAVPTVLYGHGLLGGQGEGEGVGKRIGAQIGTAVCAVDWLGMASADVGPILGVLQDFSGFHILPDRLQQAMLDFLFLGRVAKAADGFGTDPAFQDSSGHSRLAPEIFFTGNSQGGIIGGALTAVAQDWTRSFLGVPGMNYSTLLNRSVDFDSFDPLFTAAYPDPLINQLNLSFIQMLWDRGENDGYARHITAHPLPGTPAHQVLLFAAFGDHQVANVTTDVLARTMNVGLREPALADGRSTDVTPFWNVRRIPRLPRRTSGYVMWDFGTPAPPLTNQPNRAGDDPHGMGRSDPAVLAMVSKFLHSGTIIDVCGGQPCATPPPP